MADRYVFILSDYDEDGAENVTATTNRLLLEEMIGQNWPIPEEFLRDAKAKLAELLMLTAEELAARCSDRGGIHLQEGWGGIELHVVRLV